MNVFLKLRHYANRLRLLVDKKFYPEYLRRQGVRIGRNSVLLYPSYIDPRTPYLVEIGNDVVISLNVTILTHDASTAFAGDLIKVGRVRILDHCFIGMNSTILCNVTIGPNCIVGANAVVSGDIPENSVYAGNPARFICSTEEYISKHRDLSSGVPLIEGCHYEHPYISEDRKQTLIHELDTTFGYFCAQLPPDRM